MGLTINLDKADSLAISGAVLIGKKIIISFFGLFL